MSGSVQSAVVVVSYGSSSLLEANLVQVARDLPELIVVVVDNHTTDVETESVRRLCADHGWQLVASPTNVGYGVGNNLGVAAARELGAEQFLLLNPDATIDRDSFRLMSARVQLDPLALVAPTVRDESGKVWSDGVDLLLARGRMRATRKRPAAPPGSPNELVEWVSGACLLMTGRLWDLVGGFDPDYFLYWEDVDLSLRVQRAGGQVVVLPEAAAVHAEGGTQRRATPRPQKTRELLSSTYYYYNVRNRLLFAGKHLDRPTRRRWQATALSEAYQILLRGGGRRGLLRSPAPWIAAARGTVDGLRLLHRSRTQATRSAEDTSPVRVLQSFPDPRPTTNPYIVMLRDALMADAEVEVSTFTWRRALTGSFDVFHAHWPEILVSGASAPKMFVRQLLFVLMLLRMRWAKVAIVRTQHNLQLPDGITRRERWLLLLFQRWTTLLICLNESATPRSRPFEVIVHGHYRDWFAPYERAPRRAGQLGYFGLIRRYKAVDTLIHAFREIAGRPASLVVGGRPSSSDLRSELTHLADHDQRVSLRLDFLSDQELVEIATSSQLVVLPYREMHNSGGVLAALSLDRPVLVPDNEVNRSLGAEVGEAWVQLYSGERIATEDLVAALDRAEEIPLEGRPDLSQRDWDRAATSHLEAYRRAIALRRGDEGSTRRGR